MTTFERKRIRVDWEELEDAFADGSDDHRYYLDRDTGAVHFFSAYLDNEEEEEDERHLTSENRYVLIPRTSRRVPFRDLQEFVSSLDEGDARKRLGSVLMMPEGPGRFQDVLQELPNAHKKWKLFQSRHLEHRIKDWLTEIAVDPL